ncbi:MAG: hypothetical protein Q8M08_12580 [Bacteroidales bacterium]|nr:hypothetical protein [Bacteroidales bacterium]
MNGQVDSSHIHFHGTNTLLGQYSNMQGVGSEIPPSFYRNDLRMTLTVYDVPVSASFFLTSMQRDYRQSINNFRIYLDVAALAKTKKLADAKGLVTSSVGKLESAKGELENYKNLLNTADLDNVKNLGVIQKEYDKAKGELMDATSKGQEAYDKAKTKYDDLKGKLASAQSKLEDGKAKLAAAEASLNKITAQLEQAQSLVKSPDLAKKGETYVKGAGMSKMGRFLTNFSALEIGKCRPNYSELTLKGIPVSGANIEFTPGLFYVAFAMGEVKRSISPSATTVPSFKQSLIFGKMGVGRKKESHLYFAFLKVEEKVNSLPADVGLDTLHQDTLYLNPRANFILGTEAKLALFKKKFTIEGEVAASMLTRDTQSPEPDPTNSDVPKWVNDIFKPNVSSTVDYAYDVKSTLNLKTTMISLGFKTVGPGYVSLGNPNLVNDKVTWEGRIEQTLVKNQVSLSAYYRQSHDNLVNWKTSATRSIAYGITAGIRLPKLPYLIFSYTPYFQNTKSEAFDLKNSVRVITASAGYNYKIGILRSNTTFSFFYQGTEIILDTIGTKSKNLSYTFNEELSFKIPLSIAAGVSFNEFEYAGTARNIFLLTISGTYGMFKNKWQNTFGVKYTSQDYNQDKLGFFLNSRVQLWKMTDLELQLEKNTFKDNIRCTQNYNQFIARLTFIFKW